MYRIVLQKIKPGNARTQRIVKKWEKNMIKPTWQTPLKERNNIYKRTWISKKRRLK